MRTSRWIGGFVGGAAAVLAIWLTATAARADLRVPGPAKRPDPAATTRTVSFEVMVATSGGSDTPTLIIPREAVKGLADTAPLPGLDGDRLADSAADGGDANARAAEGVPAASSRLHSIIAGLSVALAVALGGVWIARGRSRTTARGLMLLLTASLCLGVSVTAWANARPPQPKPSPSPKTDAPSTRLETAFTGKVLVKFVSGDGAVQLVLPRADVEKLLGRESKDAAPGK
jgi:hypothetical protein